MSAKVRKIIVKTKPYVVIVTKLFHFERHLRLYIAGRCSYESLETTRFHHPFTFAVIIVTEH